METQKKFVEVLTDIIKTSGKTQAQISVETGVHQSLISKLCKKGKGNPEHIIKILEYLRITPKQTFKILISWFRENTKTQFEKAVWASLENQHLTEEYYIAELSPYESWRIQACTQLNIKVRDIINITKEFGITRIENFENIKGLDLIAFYKKFVEKFGLDVADEILSKTPKKDYPPIMCLEYTESRKASEYVKVENGDGVIHFGIPHLVVSKYVFNDKGGKISGHSHKYGVEFVLAIEGIFEIKYEHRKCNFAVTPDSSIYLYDGRRDHEIEQLSEGRGILMLARYCPTKRNPEPELFNEKNEKIIAL